MNGTRDTIIETAFLLFLKKGFKAVTLTDLEKAVGMTKGTFYYHFLNKEEVLKEGVTRYYRMLNNRRAEEMSRVQNSILFSVKNTPADYAVRYKPTKHHEAGG